jgi:hypothetical protein
MRRTTAHFTQRSEPFKTIGSIGEAAAALLYLISVAVVDRSGTARGLQNTIVIEKRKDR